MTEFYGPNLAYVLELYARYRADPNAVDAQTRQFFTGWTPPAADGGGAAELSPATSAGELSAQPPVAKVVGATNLAQSIREYGHLQAQLDPLGSPPPGDPSLGLGAHGIDENDLRSLPASVVGGPIAEGTSNAYEAIVALRKVYSTHIGYDYDHIRKPEERAWLREAAESRRYRPSDDPDYLKSLLDRITQVEVFEQFLQRAFPSKYRFSIEGLDMLVPMMDELIVSSAEAGTTNILIGMAHRGRLNVLAHNMNLPYEQILAEFKDPLKIQELRDAIGWTTGDVKYHRGSRRIVDPQQTNGEAQQPLVVAMPPNPSHLELVNPISVGMARAAGTRTDRRGPAIFDPKLTLQILIHGDASFPGQGVVAETFNLSQLPGYWTGGTVHIIANNQLGFTTEPDEGRSTLYASDLAKGFKVPIVHVNADDPAACIEVACIAFAYQQEFEKDFLIDLIGYRRYGHNELDEPSFTQPRLYETVRKHPTTRQLWATALTEGGVIGAGEAEALVQRYTEQLQAVNDSLANIDEVAAELVEPPPQPPQPGIARRISTAVEAERILAINESLKQLPAGFTFYSSRFESAIRGRREAVEKAAAAPQTEAVIDWATAEELAFATILEEGITVRLTGQDCERGTFSHRHAVLHDAKSGEQFVPLQALPQAQAAFAIYNSPLSEIATLGFEYGYNVQAPDRLVLWEAQYGDFINGAQPIVDEFITSAREKWGQTPSLVLLLPHAWEGAGPDHSSGRLERFLQLAAKTNMRVAYPTTAAQYFHLLRRQALLLESDPLPLVVMTPKSLLRNPAVASRMEDFVEGSWQPVIPDLDVLAKEVRRLVLCSGKFYFDLGGSEQRAQNKQVAVVRVEQLYPFPAADLEAVFAAYPNLQEIVWAQEAPKNMEAWEFMSWRLQRLAGGRWPINYVGRRRSASPAEGSSTAHRKNQSMIVEYAFQWQFETSKNKPAGGREMSINIVVPELGESVIEATVAQWLKQEGDRVAVGDTVLELDTDKVTLEVAATQDGVVGRIQRQPGEPVKAGDVLGTIEAAGGAATAKPAAGQLLAEEARPAPQPAGEEKAEPAGQRERVTPVARRMAQEHAVDLGEVKAGDGGRVTKGDVQRYLEQESAAPSAPDAVPVPASAPKPAPAAPPPAAPSAAPSAPVPGDGREERKRMSLRRQTIARRLLEAQNTAAMLTTFNEVDMHAVMALRARRKESFKAKYGVNLGLSSFFVKAAVGALKAFPELNAEIQGTEIVLKRYYDIGIAVGAAEGLVVPVLRDAERMSFAQVERAVRDYAAQAEAGKLSIEALRGGTFTITNGGVFGSLLSTPILNPPQVGILGLHAIKDRPVVVDGEIRVRPMMYVALTYDHRIVDGREAVQFLVRVKELVEDPESLLLEG